jgi:hypothetical protein
LKRVDVNNLDELMKHVLSVPDYPLYRGLSNIEYPLIPRIGRADKEELARSFDNKLFEAEKTIVGQFKTAARPYLEHAPSNEWEWRCVMQHHGSPTRLMDWSMSPLVAAFFALRHVSQSGPSKNPAVIYGIKCPDNLLSLDADVDPMTHDKVEFFPAPHISRRVTAQHSYFSYHPDPTTPFVTDDLLQIAIPPDAQEELEYLIQRLGFRETTMFPGLDTINDGLRKALKL